MSLTESAWAKVPHESHSFNSWLIFKIKRLLCSKQWRHSCQCWPCVHYPSEKAKTSQRHAKCKEEEQFWEDKTMKALWHSTHSPINIKPSSDTWKPKSVIWAWSCFLKRAGLSVHTFTLPNIMAYTSSGPACLVLLHPCLFHRGSTDDDCHNGHTGQSCDNMPRGTT